MAYSKKSVVWNLLICAALFGCIALFYSVDPSDAVWMPKCVMKQLTGWDCPACGFQRSLHAFLHGEFGEALRYNYFFIVSMPFLAALAIGRWCLRGTARLRWAKYVEHRYVVYAYIAMFFLWWWVRNL
ncbi:MAG: DUF2752 domain-containing protein [Bacteroidaceae bacterium]|nr:DUF2752 domain-containing protein [Bacteroidaceae bacterium]